MKQRFISCMMTMLFIVRLFVGGCFLFLLLALACIPDIFYYTLTGKSMCEGILNLMEKISE